MDPQTRFNALTWMILGVGAIGLLVVVALSTSWRRYQKRQRHMELRQTESHNPTPQPDAWESAGQRYKLPKSLDGEDIPLEHELDDAVDPDDEPDLPDYESYEDDIDDEDIDDEDDEDEDDWLDQSDRSLW